MSYITSRYNPSGTVIVEGFRMFLNAPDPMQINWTSGIIRSNQTFTQLDDGSAETVLAAGAGFSKISILEAKTDGTDVKVKDGPDVGQAEWDHFNATNGGSGASTVRWETWRITNGTGAAVTIAECQWGYVSGTGTELVATAYIYGDDGSNKPNFSDLKASYNPVTFSLALADGTWLTYYYRKIFSSGEYSLPDGEKCHIVLKVTSETGAFGFLKGWFNTATPVADITMFYQYTNDGGSNYSHQTGNGTNALIVFQTGGALEAPAADSGYIKIATIGTADVPIDENTDEITESAPTGTQVQIVYSDDDYRL